MLNPGEAVLLEDITSLIDPLPSKSDQVLFAALLSFKELLAFHQSGGKIVLTNPAGESDQYTFNRVANLKR